MANERQTKRITHRYTCIKPYMKLMWLHERSKEEKNNHQSYYSNDDGREKKCSKFNVRIKNYHRKLIGVRLPISAYRVCFLFGLALALTLALCKLFLFLLQLFIVCLFGWIFFFCFLTSLRF